MMSDDSGDLPLSTPEATPTPKMDDAKEEFWFLFEEDDSSNDMRRRNLRSLSVGNLNILDNGPRMGFILRDRSVESLHQDNSTFEKTKLNLKSSKQLSMERLNKLAQPKQSASLDNLLQQPKFISTAEAVYKFQKNTPERFRSQPKLSTFCSNPTMAHLKSTVPQSPNLRTKIRTRPCHIMTQQEREQIEFEDMKKFKFKAKPLNKDLLHGPLKCLPVERKPLTKPEPFKLTSLPPKKIIPQPQFVFEALPIPKAIYLTQPLPEVEKRPITAAVTPQFMKNYKPRVSKSAPKKELATSTNDTKPTKTVPTPFSFDDRENMRWKNREQLIKQEMEKEKKLREFHANPIPKSLYSTEKSAKNGCASSSSSHKRYPSTDSVFPQFKAREATVLKKSPFIPTISDRGITEFVPFQLETQSRRVEREEFDRKMKLREEELERQRQIIKAEKEQEEREKCRKLAEYKANPIRKYKPVNIQASDRVTHPVTPALNQKKPGKDKENVDDQNK